MPKTIRKEYAPVVNTEAQRKIIRRLRAGFSELADLLDEVCSANRERAVAHTNLQTAMVWALGSVAAEGEPQREE